MKKSVVASAALFLFAASPAAGQDVVRLGNLKFAHYGAVSYMKEIAPKYGLRIEENVFAKGLDIVPGHPRGGGGRRRERPRRRHRRPRRRRRRSTPWRALRKGGVRIVGRVDLGLKTVKELKGKKVGVPRGGAQELALLAELAEERPHLVRQAGREGRPDRLPGLRRP